MVSWLDMVSLAVYASASLTIRSPSAETPMLLLIFDSRSTLVIVLNMRSPVLSMFCLDFSSAKFHSSAELYLHRPGMYWS